MESCSANKKGVYSVNIVSEKDEAQDYLHAENHDTQGSSNPHSLVPRKISRSLSDQRMTTSDSPPCLRSTSPFLRSHSPAFSVAKSPRSHSVSVSPGPGDYKEASLSSGPGYTFTKSLKTKKSEEIQITPGPADYRTEVSIHSYSSILIGKPKSPNLEPTPGPADYNNEIRCFSPAYSIGNSGKSEDRGSKIEITPGPSDYNIRENLHSPVCTIGNSKRVLLGDEIANRDRSPGPSDYNKDIRPHSPSAFLIGKPRESPKKPTPGPAQYRSESLYRYPKAPAFTFAKSKREDIVRNNYPGPGEYQIAARSTSTGCIFPKSPRKHEIRSDSPGPKYNPPSTLSNRGGFIGRKTLRSPKNLSPGPGSYQISGVLHPKSSVIFSKSEKFPTTAVTAVSPCSYTPHLLSTSPKPSFSKSPRQNRLFQSFTSKNSSHCRSKSVADICPGPGAYNPSSRETSPMFSFGRSRKEPRIVVSPGPGEYTPRAFTSTKSCSFSKSMRLGSKDIEVRELDTPYRPIIYKEDTQSPPKIRSNHYGRLRCSKGVKC